MTLTPRNNITCGYELLITILWLKAALMQLWLVVNRYVRALLSLQSAVNRLHCYCVECNFPRTQCGLEHGGHMKSLWVERTGLLMRSRDSLQWRIKNRFNTLFQTLFSEDLTNLQGERDICKVCRATIWCIVRSGFNSHSFQSWCAARREVGGALTLWNQLLLDCLYNIDDTWWNYFQSFHQLPWFRCFSLNLINNITETIYVCDTIDTLSPGSGSAHCSHHMYHHFKAKLLFNHKNLRIWWKAGN